MPSLEETIKDRMRAETKIVETGNEILKQAVQMQSLEGLSDGTILIVKFPLAWDRDRVRELYEHLRDYLHGYFTEFGIKLSLLLLPDCVECSIMTLDKELKEHVDSYTKRVEQERQKQVMYLRSAASKPISPIHGWTREDTPTEESPF